ncbi:MAG: cysteine peptidase family C39 domain-containing protein [Anaeromyxobacteraceae bacterium]|nr:cysteine peptidase family C39 domain-containing protein [Anaeromyxobacteraceae bacterium]
MEKKAVKVGKAIQRQANGARRAASRTLKKARLPPAVKEAAKQAVEGPIRDFHEVEHLVGRAQGADILKGFRRSVQFDDYSCGVQCTQAILDYFDVQVSASVLEKELGTTRRGTDEDQIRSVLRKNGLRSRSFDSATMRRLRNAIAAGSPVLVSVDSGKHWSVVYGYGKGTVYLADPSFAVFATLTEERFLERWDGGGVVVFR